MHHSFSASGMTDWLSRWSYLGIILCVFVGNLGIPVPEELVLLAAGFLAGRSVEEADDAVGGETANDLLARARRVLRWARPLVLGAEG